MAIASSMPRLGVLLYAASLFTAGAFGQEPSPVRSMIEELGAVEHFGLVAQMYRARLLHAGRREGLPPELGEALAEVGARAMDSVRFINDLEAALTDALSADDVAVMRDFYRSPLGKKVKRVEVQASTVQRRADMEAHRSEFQAELNKTPIRKELFERIDRSRLMAELSAAVDASLMYVVAASVLEVKEGGATTDALAALDVAIASLREMLVQPLRDDMGVMLLYNYSRLSNKDLEVYAAFLDTEEARAVYAAMLAAANEIYEAREREIAKNFIDFARRGKS